MTRLGVADRLPTLVVVSGIDGAGKTTQARLLADGLADRGLDARYERSMGPNTAVTRALKDRVAPRFLDREDDVARKGKTTDGGPGLVGGLFVARGLWGCWTTVVANADADVLVLDRYLYDDLARVAWRYGYEETKLATLTRLVPNPDLLVRLVAPTSVAWEREVDGRTTLEEHAAKNACYERIFDALGTRTDFVTIDTHEHDVETTHRYLVAVFDDLQERRRETSRTAFWR